MSLPRLPNRGWLRPLFAVTIGFASTLALAHAVRHRAEQLEEEARRDYEAALAGASQRGAEKEAKGATSPSPADDDADGSASTPDFFSRTKRVASSPPAALPRI